MEILSARQKTALKNLKRYKAAVDAYTQGKTATQVAREYRVGYGSLEKYIKLFHIDGYEETVKKTIEKYKGEKGYLPLKGTSEEEAEKNNIIEYLMKAKQKNIMHIQAWSDLFEEVECNSIAKFCRVFNLKYSAFSSWKKYIKRKNLFPVIRNRLKYRKLYALKIKLKEEETSPNIHLVGLPRNPSTEERKKCFEIFKPKNLKKNETNCVTVNLENDEFNQDEKELILTLVKDLSDKMKKIMDSGLF